jgi:hypothetical protein
MTAFQAEIRGIITDIRQLSYEAISVKCAVANFLALLVCDLINSLVQSSTEYGLKNTAVFTNHVKPCLNSSCVCNTNDVGTCNGVGLQDSSLLLKTVHPLRYIN